MPKSLSLPSAFSWLHQPWRATELVQQVNLKIEITEVQRLNPHICLNYGSLGSKRKGVWSPEGWWAPGEAHTKDVLALLQWGVPGATPKQGHSAPGSHTPTAQMRLCKTTQVLGNLSKAKPGWAQSEHCMTTWKSQKASLGNSKHKPGNNTLLKK